VQNVRISVDLCREFNTVSANHLHTKKLEINIRWQSFVLGCRCQRLYRTACTIN